MTLKKNFKNRHEAKIFGDYLESYLGNTLKSIFCCYANSIFVKVELKETAPDNQYNQILKMFQ